MDTLASVTHGVHTIEIRRKEPMSAGNPMPYTYITVNGLNMGEVMGSRTEGGVLRARFRVFDGYGYVNVIRRGDDIAECLSEAADVIVENYRRQYPKA